MSKESPQDSQPAQASSWTVMTNVRFVAIAVAATVCQWVIVRARTGMRSIEIQSPQAVFVNLRESTVLGSGGSFREDAFGTSFNPTNSTPPFFQIFDPGFVDVLGQTPSMFEIASNDTFAFAHEAPIYVAETETLFFASNGGGFLGMSDLEHNNQVSSIDLKEVEAQISTLNGSLVVNVPITALDLPESIQMTNGGTGPSKSSLLFINSGRGPRPPNIVLVNPHSPHNATVLLDNYFGRQFNSLNDIKIHPSGKLFFTDVVYGYVNHFRPLPLLPNQVYRFDPDTGSVHVVADGFDKPNGIAFTEDGKTAYIADTGAARGFLGLNQTAPATIYAFDVDPKSHVFKNRRVLAYIDAGVPDGIQVDRDGNVYSGCGDGVHVWNADGTLLGKFFLGTTSANLVFAGPGRLVILAETKVYLAKIAASGVTLTGPA